MKRTTSDSERVPAKRFRIIRTAGYKTLHFKSRKARDAAALLYAAKDGEYVISERRLKDPSKIDPINDGWVTEAFVDPP